MEEADTGPDSIWSSGKQVRTYDLVAMLITEELNKHYTDNITEEEAEEVITKTRKLVMPLINNLLDVVGETDQWR